MDKKSIRFKETPSFLIIRRWVYSRLMGMAEARSSRRYVGEDGVVIYEKGPTACLPGRNQSYDHRKLYKRCTLFDMSANTVRQAAKEIGVFNTTGYWGCRPEIGDNPKKVVWNWICYLSPNDINFPIVYAGRSNGEKGSIVRNTLLARSIIDKSVKWISSGGFKSAQREAEQLGVAPSSFCEIAVSLGVKGRRGTEFRSISQEMFLDVVDQMKRLILEKLFFNQDWLKTNQYTFGLFTVLDWFGIENDNIDALIVDAAIAELVYEKFLTTEIRVIGEEKVDRYTLAFEEPLSMAKIKSLYLDKLSTNV